MLFKSSHIKGHNNIIYREDNKNIIQMFGNDTGSGPTTGGETTHTHRWAVDG